jgi:ABC-type nitrate/sulfonate/bicarbonate transport system substrate-binding protein
MTNSITQPETLWYTRCPVPTATGIALSKGWIENEFKSDDIEVTSLRQSDDEKIRAAHYTHALDNAFRQGGNAPAIFSQSEGAETALIGLHWVPQYQGILALNDSGITDLSHLKGKRFALPVRKNDPIDFWQSMSLAGYEAVLSLAGLTLDDVELVEFPITASYIDVNKGTDPHAIAPRLERQHTEELKALLNGKVDIIFGHSVWGCHIREMFSLREVYNLRNCGDEKLKISNGQPKTLTVSRQLLDKHPDLVDRYVGQLIKAAKWARENKSETLRILAQEIGVAEYWLDEGCGTDIANNLDISLEAHLVDALNQRQKFLKKHGFIKNLIDLDHWIEKGPLERAQKL